MRYFVNYLTVTQASVAVCCKVILNWILNILLLMFNNFHLSSAIVNSFLTYLFIFIIVIFIIGRSDGQVVSGTDCSVEKRVFEPHTWMQIYSALKGHCSALLSMNGIAGPMSSSSLSSIR